MKAGWWDTPLALGDLAEVIPIISDNGLPLLTEDGVRGGGGGGATFDREQFSDPPPPPFFFFWYLGYLSESPFIKTPLYYLELEST